MALHKKIKYRNEDSIIVRVNPSKKPQWAVIMGEAMQIHVMLQQYETGYSIVYRVPNTDVILPFTSDIIICRTKLDCQKVILEYSVINMLKATNNDEKKDE